MLFWLLVALLILQCNKLVYSKKETDYVLGLLSVGTNGGYVRCTMLEDTA